MHVRNKEAGHRAKTPYGVSKPHAIGKGRLSNIGTSLLAASAASGGASSMDIGLSSGGIDDRMESDAGDVDGDVVMEESTAVIDPS